MTKKYRISGKAISDLEKIWRYTFHKWSKEQADRYHNQIINEIEFIADNFHLSRKIDYIRSGYRMSKVKSHLIFFKKSKDGIVEVIRILHQNMDIKHQLRENE